MTNPDLHEGWLASRHWRWNALTIWIVIFTGVVIFGLIQLRHYADEIQQSRRDSILSQCRDQNQRHTNTMAFLTTLAKKQERDMPEKKKQIRTALAQYRLLIQALAPYQDCKKLSNELTSNTQVGSG